MSSHDRTASARDAYDVAADVYDDFTAHHDYEGWTALIERLARAHGLAGGRLLDVGCGTGNSFLPFLERGYQVTACDISQRPDRVNPPDGFECSISPRSAAAGS
jgi:2-polyprenyl-3-methyl-5-hydroxy-6-metoxy-1,4-benzoquinol methylase